MTPEQTIQERIAAILGNQMIQIVSMQAQIEARDTMIKQLKAAMAEKPQEADAKAGKK